MASLPEALYALPAERMRMLVQTRKMDVKKLALIPNKRQLAQFLAVELVKPASVVLAIQQCNSRQLRLLQLLLTAEADRIMPWSELLEAAGGPDLSDALHAVVAQLEDLGLAFDRGSGVYVPAAVWQQVPASLPDRYSLVRCLNSYDAASLKRICGNLGLRAGTKSADIEAIRAHLLQYGFGSVLNRPLDAEEKKVLEYMIDAGGIAQPIEIASAVLGGKADDFFRYDWQNRWKQGNSRNAVDRLLGLGLVHVVAYGYGYNLLLIIPGDLLRALTGGAQTDFWTGPEPAPATVPDPPATTHHTSITRDMVQMLGFMAVQEAARTNTGHIHKASLKNLARQLSLPNERYASFLYALGRAANLIAPVGEKQIYSITSRGNSWLCWDSLTQVGILFEAWRKGTVWAEMFSDPLEKAGEYRQEAGVVDMREAVLDVVSRADEERHYAIDSLAEALAYRHPLMLARGAYGAVSLVSSPVVFVRLLVSECLYWMGAADLGWAEPPVAETIQGARGRGEPAQRPPGPEPLSYRLTPEGRRLLGIAGAETLESDPREDQFIVQANAEIFVSPYLDSFTHYHLLALTEPPAKGSAGNTVSLTRASIRRSLDRGDSARDILAFLQAHARTGIPQNVEYLINEVSGRHGHIHIGRAQMYLQVDSPLLLQELRARREFKEHFVRALTDTVALVKSDDPDKLLRDLRKAGYLPVSDDTPQVSTLGLRTSRAPAPAAAPATTQQKLARRAAKADATIDWARIAQEDGQSWS